MPKKYDDHKRFGDLCKSVVATGIADYWPISWCTRPIGHAGEHESAGDNMYVRAGFTKPNEDEDRSGLTHKDSGDYFALCGMKMAGSFNTQWDRVTCPACLAKRPVTGPVFHKVVNLKTERVECETDNPASWSTDWDKVTCTACLAKRPKTDSHLHANGGTHALCGKPKYKITIANELEPITCPGCVQRMPQGKRLRFKVDAREAIAAVHDMAPIVDRLFRAYAGLQLQDHPRAVQQEQRAIVHEYLKVHGRDK